jgi:hypothetical protein
VWYLCEDRKSFLYGRDDPQKAREAAGSCPGFREDNDYERVSDDPVSCYNCRYRRWTRESFDCMKGKVG